MSKQMYRQLDPAAKEEIRAWGMTISGYVRSQGFSDGIWGGDTCGCFDDRCTNGYHHESYEECGCLPVILAEVRGRATKCESPAECDDPKCFGFGITRL
jgi:hypothetical protein